MEKHLALLNMALKTLSMDGFLGNGKWRRWVQSPLPNEQTYRPKYNSVRQGVPIKKDFPLNNKVPVTMHI